MFLIAALIFRPLQGFFNSTIFIYHKAYSLCQANRGLRLFHAIIQVIASPNVVPSMLVSGIHEMTVDSNVRDAQGFQFDSFIGSFGSSASRGGNNNSINSDESNIDVESVATPSGAQRSLSLHSSLPSLSVNSGSISIGYTGTSRLASVVEEDEEDIDNGT
eukprot:CAMPEP_0204632850 /NCGR_PEP_ID=MMETSP0717-20131115/25808_1 /ASSEMBLY_ACC=CAM_ASM_000666 /TAXON_ID=230516 /ORGANISM="Chaetoceros curvisetus" /LENGTH=160 /DNA_ID=CAMNT_0051650811 /DNA_START=119 /DNA_END=601 /DNA_ORIENTATION=-